MDHILRTGAALAAATLLGMATATTVSAQANCETYGKLAVKQSQEAAQKKCGFTGPRWSLELIPHITWCGTVGPDQWRSELKTRALQLKTCKG